MMITLVDYGMGNLRSVSKALEHLGAKVLITSNPQDLEQADKIVLPGVGAFGDAMEELRSRQLIDPLQSAAQSGRKILGICLGLQLLFPTSEESPSSIGLGCFPGKVKLFRSSNIKIPHMGWNSVKIKAKHPLLENVQDGSFFYFVHSYYAAPEENNILAAECTYGSETFAAMVGSGTIFATQFHPEKSQEAGLMILKNFIRW